MKVHNYTEGEVYKKSKGWDIEYSEGEIEFVSKEEVSSVEERRLNLLALNCQEIRTCGVAQL